MTVCRIQCVYLCARPRRVSSILILLVFLLMSPILSYLYFPGFYISLLDVFLFKVLAV